MSGELRFAGRKGEAEGCAAARRRSDGDRATVGLDHALHDVETKTGSPGVPPAPAPELREHAIGELLGDADPFVTNGDGDTVIPRFDDDLDGSGAVPYRILQKVSEHLIDLVWVQPGLGQLAADSDREQTGRLPASDETCQLPLDRGR